MRMWVLYDSNLRNNDTLMLKRMADDLTNLLMVLDSNDTIRADDARQWMLNGDLRMRGGVYEFFRRARHRIVPEIPVEKQHSLILDCLFDCLIQNPASGDYLHSSFEAAWEIAEWVKYAQSHGQATEWIKEVVRRLTQAYISADDTTRNRIETGAIEHMFESPSLREYFTFWKDDQVLRTPYEFCLLWGVEHETR